MRTSGPLLAFAAFGVFWGTWGVLIPEIKEQVGASFAELGAVFLVGGLAALPAMLLAGIAADRMGSRLVPPALVGFAIAVALPGLAGELWQLALAQVAVGATSGALDVSINVAATSIESKAGVRVVQKAHALFSAGFLVAAILVGVARQVGAGPVPVLLGVSALLLATTSLNRGLPSLEPAPGRRRHLVLSRPLLALGALCAVAFVVESGIENWSALFLERVLESSPALAGLGPGLFALAMVLGRTAGHGLEARVGDRTLLSAGALLSATGLTAAAVAPALPVALAGFFFGGAGISIAAPTLFGAAGRGAPDAERGSAVASVTTAAYLGFLVGPPIIGAVSGAFGLRAGILLMAAVAGLLSLSAAALTEALPLRRYGHSPRGRFP